MLKKNLFITLLVVFPVLFLGCAQMQVNQRLSEYKENFDPLLGVATKNDISMRLGIPNKTAYVGQNEMWEYYKSFGSKASANYNQYGNTYVAQGQSHEAYDKITLTFNSSGILINWHANVQR